MSDTIWEILAINTKWQDTFLQVHKSMAYKKAKEYTIIIKSHSKDCISSPIF